jgi:hypothetical protein
MAPSAVHNIHAILSNRTPTMPKYYTIPLECLYSDTTAVVWRPDTSNTVVDTLYRLGRFLQDLPRGVS